MKKITIASLIAVTCLVVPKWASAQADSKVNIPPMIRLVVPYAAGASTDVTARRLANHLGPRLGATVIVENRPGASGIIGTASVIKGPKDGSQLIFGSVSLVSAAALMKNVPFNIINDLTPVAITGEGPLLIVVNAQSKIKTPQDLINEVRAKPDQLNHGTGGVGTIAHVAAEMLNAAAKIDIRHIPYKGAAPAVTDLLGGSIDLMLAAQATFAGPLKAGQLRAVAVTSSQPSPAFPNLPTVASVVPGYSVSLYNMIYAPTGTPPALVSRLNKEIREIMNEKDMLELMQGDGFVPSKESPEQAAQRIRESYEKFKKIGADRNINIEQ